MKFSSILPTLTLTICTPFEFDFQGEFFSQQASLIGTKIDIFWVVLPPLTAILFDYRVDFCLTGFDRS